MGVDRAGVVSGNAAGDMDSGRALTGVAGSPARAGVDAVLEAGDASCEDRTREAMRASRRAQAVGEPALRRGGGGGGGESGDARASMRLSRLVVVGASVAKTFFRGTV